jgi:phosphoglycolate phosphatase-like HAD superfamily hydrolase
MRLLLFDVDGTVLTARGAGRQALGRALQAVYGTTGPIDDYDFRGKTDPRIVHDLLRAAGLDEPAIRAGLPLAFDTYVSELEALVSNGARVQLLPGVAEVVQELSRRPDTLVGLLTGNLERGAHAKLRPTGLLPFFRVGAYGSDDADRRRLPAIARARAQALTGWSLSFARVTIIGDTPLDVECARSCGARAVVVATGQHPAEELAGHGPDLLLADLADVPGVLRALVGE